MLIGGYYRHSLGMIIMASAHIPLGGTQLLGHSSLQGKLKNGVTLRAQEERKTDLVTA